MLNLLDEKVSPCGLVINTSKTKVMRNPFSPSVPVLLRGSPIDDVEEYIYLGSQLNMENGLSGELMRRRKAGWAAFNSIRNETSDLTYEQLAEVFHDIDTIDGAVEIANTLYTNLSFFRILRSVTTDPGRIGYDLSIWNNSKLESIDGAVLPIWLDVLIVSNPLLALDCTHILKYYSDMRRIRGNKNNCGEHHSVTKTNP
ncbi:hypothetical protein TELCIR_00976 [Teladorsagia circumcincta]|uniref:Receptor L-domain domain-containing protein n=1 Tax=Teladorsagia circumcincta TaxID=45464 RepID=A0A2G9V3F1_TELCI|nr:hypothetical protein TELCIR_00976 [Teladorsagia circumcincta]